MSLTDKIAEKVAGAFGFLILKALNRIATALEKGVDSEREFHGFNPIFAAPPTPGKILDQKIREEQEEAEAGKGGESDPEPDFMRQEILELLAQENHVHYTLDTDMVALGKARGWLDEVGQVLMLPTGYGGQ